MKREELDRAIEAYLVTQSDHDSDKDEYWWTPHAMAKDVLGRFADFTLPHEIDQRIAALEKQVAELKAQRAGR